MYCKLQVETTEATDSDLGENSIITYTIIDGDTSTFTIDRKFKVLHELPNTFCITVTSTSTNTVHALPIHVLVSQCIELFVKISLFNHSLHNIYTLTKFTPCVTVHHCSQYWND